MKFTTPRGTKDILPSEVVIWNKIEQISRDLFNIFGYREIRTPIFEETSLFIRSLGNTSDIVQKQMLNVAAEKEKGYSLRPEATAAIVRAYLEHNLDKSEGFVKLFYVGPMFRGERPQKGRLRQFHHIGVEALGLTSPLLDAEIISLAVSLLNRLGISDYKLKINSLGCLKDKEGFGKLLRDFLKGKFGDLCPDCRERFKKNIFRVLDCKQESCKKVISELKLTGKYLCPDCQDYFNQVQYNLKLLNISFEVMPTLVRGLDYYTHTVFEISHPNLGSQDAIGAGGRYDNLVKELGGEVKGAMGFAFGFERLIMAMGEQKYEISGPDIFVAGLGKEATG
ncbi:MAG: histidine--tRNA ligase, partial [Candidatus Omnitrophota bacterium]|nr:histidine--tRNA ligase [Candidatus Omnitrophota bacterium]